VRGGVALLAAFAAHTSAAQRAETAAGSRLAGRESRAYLIRNATIVPVVGARIANGAVLIRDGRIEAVGAAVEAPAGATVIDGTGLSVYPGLIDSGSQLGLIEIESVPGPTDLQEVGEFNPQNRAIAAVNPHSELIPVARVNGITTAVTGPTGGTVGGQLALVDLAGWTPDEMAARGALAMVMRYPRLAGRRRFGPAQPEREARETLDRQVRELRDWLAAAKAYAESRGRAGGAAAPRSPRDVDLAMAAMVPVMRGEMPVVFDVETVEQIRGVLALADSFGIRPILRGASEAWRLADTLAARRIPVIVGPLTELPGSEDAYDAVYANPGALARAGVTIAFQSNSAADARNLPYNAALATAYGLDPEEALRALTINPARIWGVADRYGSIEPGKVANLVVTTGDPLDVRTTVRHLFIRGQALPLTDRHTKLYEQFRGRPKGTQ
jgi:imidazolonepropionase-like amidohydrolase